jgi:hypothetical protein
MASDLYVTDIGPACTCGGTIYGYTVEEPGVVVARCVGCCRTRLLYLDTRTTLDAATIREHHVRANHVGV